MAHRSVGCGCLVVALFWGLAATAAPTAEQKQELAALGSAIVKAGNFYVNKKYDDAATAVKEAQEKLEKLAASGDKQVLELLAPHYSRLNKAHAHLELEGIQLPVLKPLEELAAKKSEPGKEPGKPAPGSVSFVTHVVPVLISKCGRCHVDDAKGRFSMATIENLKKGPPDGKVIFPGDPSGSRLIEVIDSGDMPRGGLKVSAEEMVVLKKWITEGASFEGKDDKTQLASLAPGAKPAEVAKVGLVQATGKETISFSRDIAPVLASTCTGCHGQERPRENFSVSTFERLLAGGDGGPVIKPGKPDESLLIQKLEGKAPGERMPSKLPALASDVIAKFRKWIEEGGKYDGANPKMELARVAALAKASGSTHEQLSADRAKLADSHWRLVMPDSVADKTETDNFLVLGNVGSNTVTEFGKTAEAVAPKVAELFKHPAEKPLVKGRMTLFIFRQRYDYSEFGKMVERRDVPPESRGHWIYGVVEAYGAMVAPQSPDQTITSLVAQQLGGTYISSLGKATPHWFGEGCGRVAASRIDPKDGRVQKWDAAIPEVVASMNSSDDFITGKLPGEQADIAAYSFAKYLMQDSRKFNVLLDSLRKGGDFAQSFSAAYGGSPDQVTDLWVRKAATAKPKKK